MKGSAYHHIFKEAVPEYWQDNHTVVVCRAEEIVESILVSCNAWVSFVMLLEALVESASITI